MKNVNFSEYAITPKYVLVHNPCEFDMFSCFKNIKGNELKSKYLFRKMPDPFLFQQQHQNYVDKLIKANLKVVYISEFLGKKCFEEYKDIITNNPNHVYTRDSIITIPWIPDGYILGNMKSEIRRNEPLIMSLIAKSFNLKEIIKIPEKLFLEGGDIIPFSYDNKKVLLIGYARRTSKKTLFFLRDTLICDGVIDEIIGLELAEWRINLDGGFVPVAENLIVAHSESIISGILLDKKSIKSINPFSFFKNIGFEIIETIIEESIFKQTCNYFCIGNKTVFGYNMSNKINKVLTERGIKVIGVEGDELVKGTGGPRCMTRPIYI